MERWQAEMSMGSLREAEDDDLDLSPLARWRSTVLCNNAIRAETWSQNMLDSIPRACACLHSPPCALNLTSEQPTRLCRERHAVYCGLTPRLHSQDTRRSNPSRIPPWRRGGGWKPPFFGL